MKEERGRMQEGNVYAALVVLGSGLVLDAVTASPSTEEAPSSMRASALVCVSAFMVPAVSAYFREQRIAAAAAVASIVSVALAGQHSGSEAQRAADGVYLALAAIVATMVVVWFQRHEARNLVLALLLYQAIRQIRASGMQALESTTFTQSVEHHDGRTSKVSGYAHTSASSVAFLMAGGTASAATSLALLKDDDGTEIIAATGAFLTFTAAFASTVASSEHLVALPGIFSGGACGDESVCEDAFIARRLAVMATSSIHLWNMGLAMLLLAFSSSIRLRTQLDMDNFKFDFQVSTLGTIGVLVVVTVLVNYLSFSGADAATDFCVVGGVIAVLVTTLLDDLIGVIMFVTACIVDLAVVFSQFELVDVYSHFTYHANTLLVAALCAHALCSTCGYLSWRFGASSRAVERIDRITGAISVVGFSSSVFLFLGSSTLAAAYNGHLIESSGYRNGDNRYARTAAVWIFWHWLPLLAFFPLYGLRCESNFLSYKTRVGIWIASPLVPSTTWLLTLASNGNSLTHSYNWYGTPEFGIAVPLVVLGWLAIGAV
jgi:hypothetical protein